MTGTSPVPPPVFIPPMSPRDAGPPAAAPSATASPLPVPDRSRGQKQGDNDDEPPAPAATNDLSSPPPIFPPPTLRLEIRDLDHPGAADFLSAVHAGQLLARELDAVRRLLYVAPGAAPEPPTRSVTLVLRDMAGVAHTAGTELDRDHKEVHLSLRHVRAAARAGRAAHEVAGVLAHELVHCYQWDGLGTCPGGLVEGVADWVRLRRDLSPPHWRRETDGRWDRGYQHTAYFLDYLEGRFGDGTVRRLNQKLRADRYEEKTFWTELLGRPVEQLWGDYVGKTGDGG